jgi:hypothetical protein
MIVAEAKFLLTHLLAVTPMTPYCGSQPRLRSQAPSGCSFLDTGAFVHGDVENYLERSAP